MFVSTTTCLTLFVRIFIALCTRTVFQPDEYFQALEPAHHIVFGYGHLTWEWVNPQPIRSIIYPALNVPIYWLLKMTGLDSHKQLGDILMINGPRVLHGSFAALTDIWLCELTRRILGERYVATALLLSLTSFFHALSLSRSLSNSLETSLTTIALAHYPWTKSISRSETRKMLVFAALACSIRATNAVIWIFLLSVLLWRMRPLTKLALLTCMDIVVVGATSLLVIFSLDSMYYGRPTFTPLSFMTTNLSGVSLFYGDSPWHYYISQAIPILCATTLPFVLDGFWMTMFGVRKPALQTLLGLIVWTVGIYSLAGHKEWRFIHPLVPLFNVFAAKSLVQRSHVKEDKERSKRSRLRIRRAFLWPILASIPVSAWIIFCHCSAPLSVMSFIRGLSENELQGGVVGFLTPCHSTPGHAYLHRPQLANGSLWALGCEPPLDIRDPVRYRDQTTIFFANPYSYLRDRFPPRVDPHFPLSPYPASLPGRATVDDPWRHEWPRYLVLFGALLEEPGVKGYLLEKGYTEVWRRGRSWEGDNDERKGGVRVWKWTLE